METLGPSQGMRATSTLSCRSAVKALLWGMQQGRRVPDWSIRLLVRLAERGNYRLAWNQQSKIVLVGPGWVTSPRGRGK